MTWVALNENGGAEHFGTTRSAFVSENAMPLEGAIEIVGDDFTDDVSFVFFTTRYPLSRWEMGLFTNGTRFQIRKVIEGTPATPITDIVSGFTGSTWKLRVEIGEFDYVFFRNDETTAFHTEPISNFDELTEFTGFGYASQADGATVSSCRIFSVVPIFDVAAEGLLVVAGGNIYQSLDGETMQLVASNAFRTVGQVSLTAYRQKVYGVDGQNAKIYDPADQSVTDWEATSGILPGATEDPDNPGTFIAGTSRATVATTFRDRIWLAGDEQDPQNLFACAIGDPLDWDTGDPVAGGAFALSASRSGRVGEPIVALLPVSNNVLLIGCTSSTWQFVGDPAFGAVDVSPLIDKHGPSGLNAMLYLSEGFAMMHTQDGLYVVPAGSSPINISRQTIERDLNLDPGTVYAPHLGYDPERQQVMVWLPRAIDQELEVHWCYEIRIGGYQSGAGGLFPDVYAIGLAPTVSARFRGELIFGCRDGRLRKWSDTAQTDDTNLIDSKAMIVVPPVMGSETVLEEWQALAGDRDNAVDLVVRGSQTLEELLTGDGTVRTLQTKTLTQRPTRSLKKSRAPVLAFELATSNAALPWELERLEAAWSEGGMIRRRARGADPASLPPIEPPADQTDNSGDDGPGPYDG